MMGRHLGPRTSWGEDRDENSTRESRVFYHKGSLSVVKFREKFVKNVGKQGLNPFWLR